jgi:hypothetical protein
MNTDPQESSGDQIEECTPKIAGENWFGCVGSRAAPYNIRAEYDGEKFPLIYDRTCGQPLTELTSNLSSIKASVSSLTASGSTYIPAGYSGGGGHYRLMHLLRTAPLLTERNYSF